MPRRTIYSASRRAQERANERTAAYRTLSSSCHLCTDEAPQSYLLSSRARQSVGRARLPKRQPASQSRGKQGIRRTDRLRLSPQPRLHEPRTRLGGQSEVNDFIFRLPIKPLMLTCFVRSANPLCPRPFIALTTVFCLPKAPQPRLDRTAITQSPRSRSDLGPEGVTFDTLAEFS